MAIVQRNAGTFNGATTINPAPSAGTFGTGTVLVVVIFSNTTWSTPGGWTQRASSVNNMGLYAFDKAGAGEASATFTTGAAGQGAWMVWELSSGSTWDTGTANENASASTTYTTPVVTPSAGNRHLLAVAGGNGGANVRNVTGFDSGFTLWGGGQGAATGDGTFGHGGDANVTANGSTGYSTTATYNATISVRGGMLLSYVNNAGDITPPTAPTGLAAVQIGSTSVDLSWTAATDNVAVTGYEIQVIGQ